MRLDGVWKLQRIESIHTILAHVIVGKRETAKGRRTFATNAPGSLPPTIAAASPTSHCQANRPPGFIFTSSSDMRSAHSSFMSCMYAVAAERVLCACVRCMFVYGSWCVCVFAYSFRKHPHTAINLPIQTPSADSPTAKHPPRARKSFILISQTGLCERKQLNASYTLHTQPHTLRTTMIMYAHTHTTWRMRERESEREGWQCNALCTLHSWCALHIADITKPLTMCV